jgi:hypothetical protein
MASFPDEAIVAFNSDGLHFLNLERETLASYGYADIYRWGGSSSQFSIIIWNSSTQDTDDVSMYTTQVRRRSARSHSLPPAACACLMVLSAVTRGWQAADMASLILDYINAIMSSTEG